MALKARVGAAYADADPRMYGTSDFSSWSSLFNLGWAGEQALASSLHCPWDGARNADERYLFYGYSGNYSPVWRYDGTSVANIMTSATTFLSVVQPRNGLSTFAGNANRLLVCTGRSDPYDAGNGTAVWLSDNALAATPTWTNLIPESTPGYQACAISGDAGSVFYFWGGNYGSDAAVAYSVDSGVTVVSQAGNLDSFTPGKVTMLVGW